MTYNLSLHFISGCNNIDFKLNQMKTKYIEGTNKQYSIREDGEVIIHYKRTWKGNITYTNCNKPIKKSGKNVSLRLFSKKGNFNFTVSSLLKKHFGFYFCNKCDKKTKSSNLYDHKCKNCIKENQYNYNLKNSYKYIELKKKMQQNIKRNSIRQLYMRKCS